ncbi:hypothetical protein BDN72DRAFT_872713 [Pluteus cervinus]|uniref:Uncharacterized protein n=1 Tax=Pluteus cervinus TaxID=181527 RepID=A0ACD3A7F7_9AGAR|nr:hypothetical protein BDN72DRAFT_872713 [Pluteus cervinus]
MLKLSKRFLRKVVWNHTILVSGDLLTGERIRRLLESRKIESTPWLRFQNIVFVMGLFHLKMACVDAIWRIFISKEGMAAVSDKNSLLSHAAQLRPKETGKLVSKPGFRRMHEIIRHVGIVSRLDWWRLAVAELGFSSLDTFAASKPTMEMLESIAAKLVGKHLQNGDDVLRLRRQGNGERDKVHENVLVRNFYFLLYEELSYAMDIGDIGRVESSFPQWAGIFQGCGKHKYAAELVRYIEDVHYRYPPSLRNAIQMNILQNPLGKAGHFRAIDWIVEHNNLYIKRIYAGQFSNRTPEYLMKQSALIEVFKSIRIQLEDWFCFNVKNSHHSPPKLLETFAKLSAHLLEHQTNEFINGRTTAYSIPDIMGQGLATLATNQTPKEMPEEDISGGEITGDDLAA